VGRVIIKRLSVDPPQSAKSAGLATIIRLLEATHIRIGNEEYSKQNESFGLTTLRGRHVETRGSRVSFYFRGKGGKKTRHQY